MKELLQQYTAYNVWANQRITDLVRTLTEEQVQQDINSSFRSIYKTLLHSWNAEAAWWRRINNLPQDNLPFNTFTGTVTGLCDEFLKQSQAWKDWAATVTDEALQQQLTYQNFAGEQFTQPVYQVVLHVVNHATFHRGQLITMFRQVGVEKLFSTDFTMYCRSN